ncbi:MAG TPA: hypothetical protein VG889_05805 [Rhizomicrobium sp.]|nr:hypothetical protein [Rhizomicrobium sp.]
MSKLVILRHGEKPLKKVKDGALKLAPDGKARARFLAETYLGKGTEKSLLDVRAPPAFFAITPHTIETACPSAMQWRLPITAYFTVPDGTSKDAALDTRTDEAAQEIKRTLREGKTVVAIWEHHRIAGTDPDAKCTLWKSLNLGAARAPNDWCDEDFDSIWTFDWEDGDPKNFRRLRQEFAAPPRKKKGKSKTKRGKGSSR